MDETPRPCALCEDPIEAGEASMVDENGAKAHSGCVYRDADEPDRDRWMPPLSDG